MRRSAKCVAVAAPRSRRDAQGVLPCRTAQRARRRVDAGAPDRSTPHHRSRCKGIRPRYNPKRLRSRSVSSRRSRKSPVQIAVSPEARDQLERDVVDPWVATHPLPDMSLSATLPSPASPNRRRRAATSFSRSVPSKRSSRACPTDADLLADLPRQVRGEIDLLRADVLPTDTLATAQGDLHSSAAALDRLAAIAESVPAFVQEERQAVLDEMNRQRALVLAAIATEREEAILALARDFAVERNQTLRDVEAQRLATLQWATGERRETIEDVGPRTSSGAVIALRTERTAFTEDVRRLIDAVLIRMVLFVIGGVVFAPLVARAYTPRVAAALNRHGPCFSHSVRRPGKTQCSTSAGENHASHPRVSGCGLSLQRGVNPLDRRPVIDRGAAGVYPRRHAGGSRRRHGQESVVVSRAGGEILARLRCVSERAERHHGRSVEGHPAIHGEQREPGRCRRAGIHEDPS